MVTCIAQEEGQKMQLKFTCYLNKKQKQAAKKLNINSDHVTIIFNSLFKANHTKQ